MTVSSADWIRGTTFIVSSPGPPWRSSTAAAGRMATVLFTHAKTVRYRLSRLQQLTDASLTDGSPDDPSGTPTTPHWWWALTTWLDTGAGSAPSA